MKESKYKCKEIKKIMIDYLSRELTPDDPVSRERIAIMENHVKTCSQCRREYRVLQNIYRETRQIDDEAHAVMAAIDWEENARVIAQSIPYQSKKQRRARDFSFPSLNWKLVVPTLAGVFILGLWLGYLLFYPPSQVSISREAISKTDAALARLETTLTKKEMQGYFQKTQLLLTDLMRQCEADGTASWATQINRQRARTLLNKNRYFNQDILNPQLLSTRRLLKKIEWLLYEVLTLDEEVSCDQLRHLQDYIQQERLLLKLRLVGKDISYSEV
jgi:hypothetical protein